MWVHDAMSNTQKADWHMNESAYDFWTVWLDQGHAGTDADIQPNYPYPYCPCTVCPLHIILDKHNVDGQSWRNQMLFLHYVYNVDVPEEATFEQAREICAQRVLEVSREHREPFGLAMFIM